MIYDEISTQILRAARLPAMTITPLFTPTPHEADPDAGHWSAHIPGEDGAGLQIFRAPTLEGLCSKLAQSVYYGTAHIRRLTRLAKERDEDLASGANPYPCGFEPSEF